MSSYEAYLDGALTDYELPQSEIHRATADLPAVE
jgi:hypothetical protein